MTGLVEFDIGNALDVTDPGIVQFTSRVKKLKKLYLPYLKLGSVGIKAIADSKGGVKG